MRKSFFIIATCLLILSGCEKRDPSENIVVLVKYKAQPAKSVDAVTGLMRLIDEVRKEDHFVNIKLHIDQNDNSNILLYEEWDDEAYYRNQHMKTEHLQRFIVDSREFLAGPPEISYWKLNSEYR